MKRSGRSIVITMSSILLSEGLNDINREMIERYDQKEHLRVRYGIDIDSIENEEGRVRVNYSNALDTLYDRVIYALGGTTSVNFLRKIGKSLKSMSCR